MALIVNLYNMSDDQYITLFWYADKEYESIEMHIIRMYGAVKITGETFQFPNKEKYTEFMLKWF